MYDIKTDGEIVTTMPTLPFDGGGRPAAKTQIPYSAK